MRKQPERIGGESMKLSKLGLIVKCFLISPMIYLALYGCASTSVIPLKGYEVGSRAPSKQVDVYASRAGVKRLFTEIAILKVKTDVYGDEGMVGELKEKAAEIGADAIILQQSGSDSFGGMVVGNQVVPYSYNHMTAVAIIYN